MIHCSHALLFLRGPTSVYEEQKRFHGFMLASEGGGGLPNLKVCVDASWPCQISAVLELRT